MYEVFPITLVQQIFREVIRREEKLKEEAKKKHTQDDEDDLRKLYSCDSS